MVVAATTAAKHIQTEKEKDDMQDQQEKTSQYVEQRATTGISGMILTAWRKLWKPEAEAGKQTLEPVNCLEHLSVDELSVALRPSEPSNRYPSLPG